MHHGEPNSDGGLQCWVQVVITTMILTSIRTTPIVSNSGNYLILQAYYEQDYGVAA